MLDGLLNTELKKRGYAFTYNTLTLDGQFQKLKCENFSGWYVGQVQTTKKNKKILTLVFKEWKNPKKQCIQVSDSHLTKKINLKLIHDLTSQPKLLIKLKARSQKEPVKNGRA